MVTTKKEQVLRTQSRMSFDTLSVRNFQTLKRGRSYDSTIHIQLLQQSVLEDRHESAIEQVLRITMKHFLCYKNPQRFADG